MTRRGFIGRMTLLHRGPHASVCEVEPRYERQCVAFLSVQPSARCTSNQEALRQNGIAKSFNGRVREELLNAEISRTSIMQVLSARIGETNTTTNGRGARLGVFPERAVRRHDAIM